MKPSNFAAEGPIQTSPSGGGPAVEPAAGPEKEFACAPSSSENFDSPFSATYFLLAYSQRDTAWHGNYFAKFISVQLFRAYAILDNLSILNWGGFLKSCLNSVPLKPFLHICCHVPRSRRATLQVYSHFFYSQAALCYRFLWQEIPVICFHPWKYSSSGRCSCLLRWAWAKWSLKVLSTQINLSFYAGTDSLPPNGTVASLIAFTTHPTIIFWKYVPFRDQAMEKTWFMPQANYFPENALLLWMPFAVR